MDVFALTATLSLQAESFFSTLESAAEAIVQFAADSVQTSATFDKSMSHVRAISGKVQGSAEEQAKYMENLISTANEMGIAFERGADNTETAMNIINAKSAQLGRSTQFTASEVADAFGYMAMAGWDYQSMLSGIDGVVSLAAASGEDLARTSDIVTDALTGFGMKAGDAGDFADLLAITSARANTNVSMMGETFKYVAPIAGTYGITAEDTAEAIGLMANAGIKATQAGTSLRSILTRLATDTGASEKELGALGIVTEKLGVDFYNSEGKIRDFSDFMDDMREAWKGLDTETQAEYGKKIAGMYGMAGFLSLMNATDEDVGTLQESIANRTGASAEMMNIMIDNLAGDMTIFESAVDAVKRTVGEELTPMMRDFTQHGTSWLDTLLLAYGEGGLDALPDAISTVVQDASDLIDEYLPEWEKNGKKIMETISAGIEKASPVLGKVIGTLGPMIGDFLSENADTITATVSDFIASISPGIIAAVAGIFDGIGKAWPEISKTIGKQLQKYGVYDWINENLNFMGLGGVLSFALESLFPGTSPTPPSPQIGIGGAKVGSANENNSGKTLFGKNGLLNTGIGLVDDLLGTGEKRINELGAAIFGTGNKKTPIYTFETLKEYTNTVNEAYDAIYKLEGVANAQILTESYHNDMTTEYAKSAYDAVVELLKENDKEILTKSIHVNDTSITVQEALDSFLSLYYYDKYGVRTFSEHRDDASTIIENLFAVLAALKEDDGYTSHTSSTHDVITNHIDNYIVNKETGTTNAGGTSTTTSTGARVNNKKELSFAGIHAQSMFDGTILRGATMFGWDAQGRPQIGGGEGPEAVVGVNSLNQQIREAVRDGLSGIVGNIAQAIGGRNEQPVYVVLDTGELVGAIGGKMDAELGKIGAWKSGGAA